MTRHNFERDSDYDFVEALPAPVECSLCQGITVACYTRGAAPVTGAFCSACHRHIPIREVSPQKVPAHLHPQQLAIIRGETKEETCRPSTPA